MSKFVFYDDKIINLLIKNEKPSGGAAVQAYGWIKGLSEAEQDVYIVTNVIENEPIKDECIDIKLVPLYDKKKGIRWLRWLYYRLPYIYTTIKKIKPDYLYQGVPGWTSFFIGLICYHLTVKYVIRISNDYLLDDRIYLNYTKTHRFFQRLGFRLAYCILCQNEYQYSRVKKEFPEKKVLKISNPILLKFPEVIEEMHSRPYIAWLGLYQYQKNLKLLYEIAQSLKNENFLIAGKESSKCDDETRYYLAKLAELPNVKFVGFLQRDQVMPFLARAKYLLNTSHYEGFSNTFLEAMSAGTPIISSEKVNPDNIIPKYSLGIIYHDASDLKSKIGSVTPNDYKSMTENVLSYVINNHDHKVLANRLVNFLNEIKLELITK